MEETAEKTSTWGHIAKPAFCQAQMPPHWEHAYFGTSVTRQKTTRLDGGLGF